MKNRILVAAILLPIVYFALWAPWNDSLLFALLITVAISVGSFELMNILRAQRPYVPAAIIATSIVPLVAWRISLVGTVIALVVVVPLTIIFASLSVDREDPLGAITSTLFPIAYLTPAAALLVALRQVPDGFGLVLLMFLGIWANDTGAYFVGRFLGRTKLAPRISPKKTVEGFVGGFIAGTLVIWYGHFVLETNGKHLLGAYQALLIGMAVALATPVGDLFESMLKRAADVKDSSHLLGEHGGMLDRVDSILLAAPVMYIGCYIAGVV